MLLLYNIRYEPPLYNTYVRCLSNSLFELLRLNVSVCVCVGLNMCVPLLAGAPSNSMVVWPVLPFRPWTAGAVFFVVGVDPSGSGLRARWPLLFLSLSLYAN